MADTLNNASGLEKPAGMQKPADELIIHVIPDKFYGAALKKKLPKVVPEKPIATPVPGGRPAIPAPGAAVPPKKGKKWLIIAIGVGVVLAGGAAAAFVLLSGPKTPTPKGPVCGDAACETGETFGSCPADCKPPAPICGDKKCDASESPQSCEIDCGPPPAVCGNTKCESGETTASCAVDCPAPAECGNDKCESGETTASCAADCKPPEPVPGADTDSDGLTDLEERSIYGTNPRLSNSDGDSYVDLNEVLNLFDPADPKPMPLTSNSGITVHSDTVLGYELYRPTAWTLGAGPEGQTRFNAPTGEHVDLITEDLASGDTLVDWYASIDPAAPSTLVPQRTRQGYEYLVSPNRFAIFIQAGDRIFVLSYDLNGSSAVQYRVTFEMMANSFRLVPAAR
jgi:hypothetical protein